MNNRRAVQQMAPNSKRDVRKMNWNAGSIAICLSFIDAEASWPKTGHASGAKNPLIQAIEFVAMVILSQSLSASTV